MKKMFACVLALCPMIASADYLDDKIASLTKEKLDKIAKLEECQKSTKGLKIAGITTLGVSAIGIGANIGEAVKLNKLETQINTAETNKSNLDKQISAAEEEKAKKEKAVEAEQERRHQAANNTCGNTTSCTGAPNAESLNATDVVCINGVNKAKECKENFAGTRKSCTSNGATVTYYENCSANASTETQCQSVTEDWKKQNHVKSTACDTITGENYITACEDNFDGVQRTAGNKQGYEKCVSNIPECGNNCSEICDNNCLTTKYSAKQVVCVNGQNKPLSCLSGSPIGAAKQCRSGGSVVTYYDSCPQSVQPLVGCPECDANCLASLHAKLVRCNEQKHENFIVLCEDGYKGSVALPDGGWLQCVKDTSEPKEQQGQSIYEKMVEENKKLEEKISKSDLPEEISLTKQIVNDNKEFLDRTEEMIQVSMDDYGNIPAWNLVGNAVKATPAVPTYLPNQFRGTSSNAVGLPVPAKKTEAAPAAPVEPVAPVKAGRDMGGGVITYTTFYDKDNYDMLATITVDGTSHEAVAHVMAFPSDSGKAEATERAVRKKLKELGYNNYTLKKSN